MWSALKSDLQVFVTSVTADTTTALNRMDDSFPEVPLTAEEKEVIRRIQLEETFTTPLLKPPKKDDTAVKDSEKNEETDKNDDNDDDNDDNNEKEKEEDGEKEKGDKNDGESDENEQDDDEGEDDEEEEDDFMDEETRKYIEEYIESFNVEEMTQEITVELEKYPDLLKPMFESLVPTRVTYKEFWQRYFYRCNPDRIGEEWAAAEEREREERAQAVTNSLQGVRSFLGTAVSRVSKTLQEADLESNNSAPASGNIPPLGSPFMGGGGNGTPTSTAAVMAGSAAANATTAMSQGVGSFFGGRPPFVYNTAVDEDDDEQEQEEEELGWDDDEEEDDDDNKAAKEQDVETDDEEHIEFKDVATEKLHDQLKQALEERDALHQTVELQNKEIVNLKKMGLSGDIPEDIQELQTLLFEKESEIAALKASKLDVSHDGAAAAAAAGSSEAELQEMEGLLSNMVEELKQLTAVSQADKAALQEAYERNAQLEAMLAGQGGSGNVAKITALKLENEALRKQSSESSSSSQQVAALSAQLESLKSKLTASEKQVKTLTTELAATKEKMAHASRGSPDTISTGIKVEPEEVKIPTPKSSPVTKIATNNDDESEDWGDDW